MKIRIGLSLFVFCFSSLCHSAGRNLIPSDAVPPERDCAKGLIPNIPGNSMLVVVGRLADGTPIVERMSLDQNTTVAAVPTVQPAQPPAVPAPKRQLQRRDEETSLSTDSLLQIARSMRADQAPSPESVHALMGAALTNAIQYDPEQISIVLRKTIHPLAVVWLAHMLFVQKRLDLVPNDKWNAVIQSLDNTSSEKVPDYALTGTRAAVEVLLNADLPDDVISHALEELRASASYESDFGVKFIAALAYRVHSGESTFDWLLRDNLSDTRIPVYILDWASGLLRTKGIGSEEKANGRGLSLQDRQQRDSEPRRNISQSERPPYRLSEDSSRPRRIEERAPRRLSDRRQDTPEDEEEDEAGDDGEDY